MTDRGLMGGNAGRSARRSSHAAALSDLVTELTERPPPEPAAPAARNARRARPGSRAWSRPRGRRTPVLPRSPRDRRQASRPLRQRGRRAPDRPAQEPRSALRRARAPPDDVATRAEAAYSAAQILRFSGWELQAVEEASLAFELPVYTPWQRRILQTAFNLIGYPYVWGGTSSGEQALFGVSSRGGFDCSGFAWRVYKLHSYSGGKELASTLRGRTAAQMAGEVPKLGGSRSQASSPATSSSSGAGAAVHEPPRSTTWGSTRVAAG